MKSSILIEYFSVLPQNYPSLKLRAGKAFLRQATGLQGHSKHRSRLIVNQ